MSRQIILLGKDGVPDGHEKARYGSLGFPISLSLHKRIPTLWCCLPFKSQGVKMIMFDKIQEWFLCLLFLFLFISFLILDTLVVNSDATEILI